MYHRSMMHRWRKEEGHTYSIQALNQWSISEKQDSKGGCNLADVSDFRMLDMPVQLAVRLFSGKQQLLSGRMESVIKKEEKNGRQQSYNVNFFKPSTPF